MSFGYGGPLTLDGMTNIEYLGGFELFQNVRTTNLDALNALTRLDSLNIELAGTNTPVSLSGFQNLSYLESLTLDSAGVDDLLPLANVANQNVTLSLDDVAGLTSLDGLDGIADFASIELLNNNVLVSLDGLTNVTQVDSDITISNNPSLSDITALSNITTVGGHITFDSNASLCVDDVSDLASGLLTFGGTLTNTGNTGTCNPANDADGDGVLVKKDCDDNDPTLGDIGLDADCDGVLTVDDCHDKDDVLLLTCTDCIGDYTLTNVTSATDWSAVETCRTISGNLNIIDFESDVSHNNVEPLEYLTDIGGRLSFISNGASYEGPATLNGLAQLKTLGSLEFIYTYTDTDLSALSGLAELDSLYFYETDISSLSGLDNLTELNSLQIVYDVYLADLSALSGVTTPGISIYLGYNNSLASLAGLEGLTSLTSLHIENVSMPSLSGLDNVTEITNDLYLSTNTYLSDISALSSLGTVGGDVTVSYHSNLCSSDVMALEAQLNNSYQSFVDEYNTGTGCSASSDVDSDGVPASEDCDDSDPTLGSILDDADCDGILSDVDCDDDDDLVLLTCTDCTPSGGTIFISGSTGDWSSIETCKSVNGNLTIQYLNFQDSQYGDLQALEYLTSVSGRRFEYGGPNSLDGLSNLQTLGSLEFYYSNVSDMSGLANLTALDVFRVNTVDMPSIFGLHNLTALNRLELNSASNLSSLSPLANVTTPGIVVSLTNNFSLTDLSGLAGLTSADELVINNNGSVQQLTGLDQLTSVTGNLDISDNANLSNISALSDLLSVGGDVTFNDNTALCQDDIFGVQLQIYGTYQSFSESNNLMGCAATDADGDGVAASHDCDDTDALWAPRCSITTAMV